MRDRRRKDEHRRRSVQLQALVPAHTADARQLVSVLEECIAIGHIKGASFLKLVQFLRDNDYKSIDLNSLREETRFIMLKALDRWLVEIFCSAHNQDLPAHAVILAEFYRHASRTFRVRRSQKTLSAYAHFLNNMAMLSLRSKQYTKSLDYFQEIVEMYNSERIQQCVFSIAHANLAVIYKQLNEQEKSEMHILQATSITKEILERCLVDGEPINRLQEVGGLLAAQSALMTQIVERVRFKDPFTRIVDLVKKGHIKPSQRKHWNVKNLLDKLAKGEPIAQEFQPLFKMNLEELKFYTQIGRNTTAQTHIRLPTLELPTIPFRMASPSYFTIDRDSPNISKYSKVTLDPHEQHTFNRYKPKQPSIYHQERNTISSDQYQEEIKEQYTSISVQNKELKNAVETLIQKQNETEKILEKLILPKIVEAVSSPQGFIFGKSEIPLSESKIVFKNLRANIEYTYEGIIVTSFGGGQQKISWNALKHLMNRFQFLDLFWSQLSLNSSQYETAKMLFRYINVEKNIRILNYPQPDYTLKLLPNTFLEFYHIRDELFRIGYVVDSKLLFIIHCEMCTKTFNKYFKLHKHDEFAMDICQRMAGTANKKKEYFVEVIKYKEEEHIEQPLMVIALNMESVLVPIKEELKNRAAAGEGIFLKLNLDSDVYESTRLFGSLFIIQTDDASSKLIMKFHSLNDTSGVAQSSSPAGALVRQHPYWYIQQDYGVDFMRTPPHQRELMKNFICDMFHLKEQNIKFTSVRRKSIVYLDVGNMEIGGYRQDFVEQHYYRPVRVAVIGAAKKKHGLRFGLYNEYGNSEESFLVILQDNQQKDKKESDSKAALMSKILKKLDLKDIFLKYKRKKPEVREQIFSAQTFLELYMWA